MPTKPLLIPIKRLSAPTKRLRYQVTREVDNDYLYTDPAIVHSMHADVSPQTHVCRSFRIKKLFCILRHLFRIVAGLDLTPSYSVLFVWRGGAGDVGMG